MKMDKTSWTKCNTYKSIINRIITVSYLSMTCFQKTNVINNAFH